MQESKNPSVVAMEHLLDELRKAKDLYQSADDSGREGCLRALNAVTHFLMRFRQFEEEALFMPILQISLALANAGDGITSPLTEVAKQRRRKPQSINRESVLAFTALSVDLLMKAGMRLDDAARDVAKVLNRNGVTVHGGGGKQVTAITVINWRKKIQGDIGKGYRAELYENLRHRIEVVSEAPTSALRRDILQRLERILMEMRAADEQPLDYAS